LQSEYGNGDTDKQVIFVYGSGIRNACDLVVNVETADQAWVKFPPELPKEGCE